MGLKNVFCMGIYELKRIACHVKFKSHCILLRCRGAGTPSAKVKIRHLETGVGRESRRTFKI